MGKKDANTPLASKGAIFTLVLALRTPAQTILRYDQTHLAWELSFARVSIVEGYALFDLAPTSSRGSTGRLRNQK